MKARPIIFDGESVRAILAGTKTQTRRVMKAVAFGFEPSAYELRDGILFASVDGEWSECREGQGKRCEGNPARCPYGAPGDELWVREAHYRFTGCAPEWEGFVPSPIGDPYQARCYDDSDVLKSARLAAAALRMSPIHMPRWASRITLRVTDVRAERVQDISEADAMAEGVSAEFECDMATFMSGAALDSTHILGFKHRWDAVNEKRGYPWSANPWVWVVTFEVQS